MMFKLIEPHIHLQQVAAEKKDALLLAGRKMVELGLCSDHYVSGILAREAQCSSFLENGIAIPHALPEYRHAILKNGVVFMQFPKGVDWGDKNTVHLVFAIAADDKDHLKILSCLAAALDNRELCQELAVTVEPERIISATARPGDTLQSQVQKYQGKLELRDAETGSSVHHAFQSGDPVNKKGLMSGFSGSTREFVIRNAHGLHARCSELIQSASTSFDVNIYARNVSKKSGYVNGRSLIKLLSLRLTPGDTVELKVSGDQAVAAMDHLEKLIGGAGS